MVLPNQKASIWHSSNSHKEWMHGRIKIFGKPLKGKQALQRERSPTLVPQAWPFSESYFVENV